ncbi:uncharacterized protein LOC111702186 [Eurytemora carolleeae]|uniref:uncharacterized protein LOC111702186 n=1 Tax=Eurytemora carolleeae TaxID=1294199 RepID=UPI000C78C420|nr:uncharacterized protein LOC111702186 [Eurytemora carolleeae]|eukprot:XP_023329564.1 uncharacterized protein LOC111702186 [Eurytemora affinis]
MRLQHDSQVQAFQVQQTDRREEEVHKEKNRIESLKLKDETCQSAVASPEVKRRLQEVILQRKRKDAAASMGNLKIGIPPVSGGSTPLQTAILRKVQSESNLLKIKNKRGDRSSGPYSRTFNHQLRLVPECAGGSEDSTPSPISCSSLTNPNLLLQCKPVQSSSPDSSSPSSPQGVGILAQHSLQLGTFPPLTTDPGTPTEVCFQYFMIRGLPQRYAFNIS